jgi:hypothetical protein
LHLAQLLNPKIADKNQAASWERRGLATLSCVSRRHFRRRSEV